MAAFFDGQDLHLVGAIGFDLFEDYFTHGDVLYALAEAGRNRDLTIYLNSPGGVVDDGEGIANAIIARPGKTTVIVAGMAMSAATIIACSADECLMSDGSLYMIHEPNISLLDADSDGLEKATNLQRIATDGYARTYARKTGQSEKTVRDWMKKTAFFGADEAIEAGFVDGKTGEVVDFMDEVTAFPYGIYANAPDRLVAMARKKHWTLSAEQPAGKRAAFSKRKGKTMPQQRKATTPTPQAAATARIRAIMKAPEADGRQDLAEHLALETEIDAEAARQIMNAAPRAEYGADGFDPEPNGMHLGIGSTTKRENRLAATMKKRHGIT